MYDLRMAFNVDQQKDYSNKELYKFLKISETPEFVKTASVDSYSDYAKIKKHGFADPEKRLFPIDTAARTYISNAFFQNNKKAVVKTLGKKYAEQLEHRIKKAAEVWGVSESLEKYNKDLALSYYVQPKTIKIAEINENGVSLDFYEVSDAEQFKQAAEHFCKNIDKHPFKWRRKISEEFVKKASHFSVDEIPDIIMKYAGMFYAELPYVSKELWRRSTKLGEEAKAAYQIIQNNLSELDCVEDIFKIAEICDELEKKANLSYKVKEILGDPVDRLFDLPIEKVAQMLDVVKVHGKTYSVPDFVNVSKEIYTQAFGADIDPTNKVELVDFLPTAPLSDFNLFLELTNIKPIE